MVAYTMATSMKRKPQIYLTSTTVLDAMNVSNSEEASGHESDSACYACRM